MRGEYNCYPHCIDENSEAVIPTVQMGRLRVGPRDLAKVTGLTKGKGGVHAKLFPDILPTLFAPPRVLSLFQDRL